jgi:predicted nucleic acid-binding protein
LSAPAPTAILDACVLYPAALRDLLMRLTLAGCFHARWSDAIHDEWTRSLARDRPDLTTRQIDRIRTLMDQHAGECLMSGFESLIPTIALPDPDDRHVLAAAIRARADLVVTFNLDDFPAEVVGNHGIEAVHPDVFLERLLSVDEAEVIRVVKELRQGLRSPPVPPEDYLTRLRSLALPRTAAWLGRSIDRI